MQVEAFTVRVEDSVLQDLQQRLKQTKLGNSADFTPSADVDADYGQTYAFQDSLLQYWRDTYDWRKHEAELNTFAHFRASNVLEGRNAGAKLHFIHQRSRVPGAVPLLLLHGWPGSVWEFHSVIRKLVAPEAGRALRLKQAFHVVAPSLPGFAWSDAPTQAGVGASETARALHKLMLGLGYAKYAVQGGDWGSTIAREMALQFPFHCVAIHVNMPLVHPPALSEAVLNPSKSNLPLALRAAVDKSALGKLFTLTEREQDGLVRGVVFAKQGSAYYHLQRTKPHTPGFALSDSPSGLLAWISEKLALWADGSGNVLNALNKDEILTNVMIYWVTNSITSSMRFYRESELFPSTFKGSAYVQVPTGVASFPKEMMRFPKRWLELSHNLVHYTEFAEGGHFAAWEQPDQFVQELRQFFHRALPFERAVALAEERQRDLLSSKPAATNLDLATNLLLFAPVLPIPAVAALASYLLVSKL